MLLSSLVLIVIALFVFFFLKMQMYMLRYEEMRSHYISLVMTLAAGIDSKDIYEAGHTERVTKLCMDVADALKARGNKTINKRFRQCLTLAALLHDIGKVGIPEYILRKPGPLSKEEWEEMKKHPTLGANILEPLKEYKNLKEAVRAHQEHFNGMGYPDGLTAEEIPLMARIIMLVDAYDAMTSERPYRETKTPEGAIEEIKGLRGAQFDPEVVDAFVEMMEGKKS